MYVHLNNFMYYNDWSRISNFIGKWSFMYLSNSSYKYQLISYLSLIKLFSEFPKYSTVNFKVNTLESSLINGFYDQTFVYDVFIFNFPFELSNLILGIDYKSDYKILKFKYHINYVFIEIEQTKNHWVFDFNYFAMLTGLNVTNCNLIVNDRNDYIDHNILYTNKYNMIDNYKYYGVDDYTMVVESFSDLSLTKFLCLRYGFGSYLSNTYSQYLGISKEFNVSLIKNYWHYSRGELYFESKLDHLDTNLAKYVLNRHSSLISLNSRKGIRLSKGFPIYGQRTRSNSKTASKFPYTISFKSII